MRFLAALSFIAAAVATKELPVLTVHLVPHTHDDVGWLKTVDQYYYGGNNTIQHAAVRYILQTVVPALEEDPSRKFVYVEQAFFTRWWFDQTPRMQSRVKSLVSSGQLSFANGGWCMHDEAATHYLGMLDQTKLGHDFLRDTFEVRPTVGWQIDPFGHSAAQASLMAAEVGFDAIYFGRIDWQDLDKRRREKRVEGIWRSSESLAEKAETFFALTGSNGGNYQPPDGFNFDMTWNDEPIIGDSPGLYGNNIAEKVSKFVDAAWRQSNEGLGTNIMMTMGSDFQYENAFEWFVNLDFLIKHVNEYNDAGKIAADPNGKFSGMKLIYSSPNEYTLAKNKEDVKWEVKTDDFLPYSDCTDCFWTGYFTSRAELKKWERAGSSFLQAVRQIEALDTSSQATWTFDSPLHKLDAAVGVAQHHDGVSGTSKQHVAFDYALRIADGYNDAAAYAGGVLEGLLLKPDSTLFFGVCHALNVSICEPSQSLSAGSDGDLFVAAYNSLSHTRSEVLALPVAGDAAYTVETSGGLSVPSAVLKSSWSSQFTPGSAPYTLFFAVDDLQPLATKLFKISAKKASAAAVPKLDEATAATSTSASRALRGAASPSQISIKNDAVSVDFDSDGRMTHIDGKKVEQTWGYYTSFDKNRLSSGGVKAAAAPPLTPEQQYTPLEIGTCLPGFLDLEGDESFEGRQSQVDTTNGGAYLFRPQDPNEKLTELKPSAAPKVIESDLVKEVHAQFGEWVSQVTRIYKGSPYVEVEWSVGPVDITDGIGKEVITRFNSDVKSGKEFFTDSNGRDFMRRVIDYRETWDIEVFQPIAGNYYPINSAIYIEDDSSALSVLTDRTQGGSSLSSGAIELMIQRRLLADDGRGVGENLDETVEGVNPYPPWGDGQRTGGDSRTGVKITGKTWIRMGGAGEGAKNAREKMESAFGDVKLFMAKGVGEIEDHFSNSEKRIGMKGELPPQISLITLSKDYGEKHAFFVRYAHQYGVGEDVILSLPASFDMSKVLPMGFKLKSFEEMTLTGNQSRKSMEKKRLKWTSDEVTRPKTPAGRDFDSGNFVTLMPMEIRAFKVIVESEKL